MSSFARAATIGARERRVVSSCWEVLKCRTEMAFNKSFGMRYLDNQHMTTVKREATHVGASSSVLAS
jgi:hypothetical protein